jgi:hypothetical protein
MPTITNKTRKPVSVPLPQGKRLFLGPAKSGQITPKAVDHPPLKKLIDEGVLELSLADSRRDSAAQGTGLSPKGTQDNRGAGGVRHTGDR